MERRIISHNKEPFFNILSLTKTRVPGPDEIFTYNIFNPGEKLCYRKTNTLINWPVPAVHKTIIAISLYREEFLSLSQTLSSIFENKMSGKWLLNSALIIIISDGYEFLDNGVALKLKEWKLYDQESIKEYIDENSTYYEDENNPKDIAFMFEGQLKYQTDEEDMNNDNSSMMDVIFLTKLENKGKLHSHLWLYRGFCTLCDPDYVVVIYN